MKFLLKIAGKEDTELAPEIGVFYIVRLCAKYGIMLIRGFLMAVCYPRINNKIFKGKGTKFINKRKMEVGTNCKFHDCVYVDALSKDGVVIGDNVVIGRNTRIECTGSVEYVGEGVTIGKGTTFANDCFLGAAGGILIGENVVLGQYVRFHSENHNYSDKSRLIKQQGVSHKGIKVGNDCWIGSGVVFLDGAEIGNGCVVAANAVVSKKFPDNVVIGGVPAKIIKER